MSLKNKCFSTLKNEKWKTALTFILFAIAVIFSCYQQNYRTYLPFMVLTYLVALIIYYAGWQRTAKDKSEGALKYLFGKHLWFHKSAIEDYSIISWNIIILAITVPVIALSPNTLIELTQSIISSLQISKENNSPGTMAFLTYLVLSFIGPDFMYYWAHRLQHEIPWLWQFHKVHHSAEVLTPLTQHRIHPVELWMSLSFRTFATGIIAGAFLFFYPSITTLISIAGIHIFFIFFNATTANLRHSHVWLSFGPAIEKVIMSPAQHQIHHSTAKKHFDKNYGADLSLWDWLFGTAYLTDEREELSFGISEKERSKIDNTFDLYVQPFQGAAKIIKRKRKKPQDEKKKK